MTMGNGVILAKAFWMSLTFISQGNNLILDAVIARLQQLVPLTPSPVGQVLNDQQSAVNFTPDSPFDPAMAERGLTFWESLLNGPKGASQPP